MLRCSRFVPFVLVLGAAALSAYGAWEQFLAGESSSAKCNCHQCPNGGPLLCPSNNTPGCEPGKNCCAHYNCATSQATSAVCCSLIYETCKRGTDMFGASYSYCALTDDGPER